MSFNDNSRLDTSQVGPGGGRGGRGVAVGGGLGGIILLVVAGLLVGQDGRCGTIRLWSGIGGRGTVPLSG